jgi:hypothetical protein
LTDTTYLGSIDLLNLPKLVFSELNFYLFYYFISTLRDAMAYFQIKNILITVVMLTVSSPSFCQVNLISGGDFQPSTGWSGVYGDTSTGSGNVWGMKGDGSYIKSQVISGLSIGRIYEIQFAAAGWVGSSLKYTLFGIHNTVSLLPPLGSPNFNFDTILGQTRYTATTSTTTLFLEACGEEYV